MFTRTTQNVIQARKLKNAENTLFCITEWKHESTTCQLKQKLSERGLCIYSFKCSRKILFDNKYLCCKYQYLGFKYKYHNKYQYQYKVNSTAHQGALRSLCVTKFGNHNFSFCGVIRRTPSQTNTRT